MLSIQYGLWNTILDKGKEYMTIDSHHISIVLVSFGIIIASVGTQIVDRMYPILPGAIIMTLICLISLQFYRQDFSIYYLLSYIILSTFYRVFLYMYPASFTGADSDKFAFYIERLITTGSLSSIQMGFYQDAPTYLITGQIFTIITGGNTRIGLAFIPILVGIMFPLTSFLLARYLPLPNPTQVSYLAAAITILDPVSVILTKNPIAQSLAVILGLTAILSLVFYIHHKQRLFFGIAFFCLGIILWTHKFAPYSITVAFLFAAGASLLYSPGRLLSSSDKVFAVSAFIMAVGIYVQGIITGLDSKIVGRLVFVSQLGTDIPSEPLVTSVAEPTIQSKALLIGLNAGYQAPMFALAGIAWFGLLWRNYDCPVTWFILSLVALGTGLSISSYFGIVSFNSVRPLLLIIPFLSILIASTIVFLATTSSLPVPTIRIALAIVLLITLLSGQAISLQASSDSTLQERTYLTEPELSAKTWGDGHAHKPIITDDFYAKELPPSQLRVYAQRESQPPSHYQGATREILSGKVAQGSTCTVALRLNADQYSYQRPWTLTHPITTGFEDHHLVYSSGSHGTYFYNDPNCEGNT